ncbi:CHD1 helical C-terminal domain containing protein 1 [Eublepharis macularius]|uniref:CHD1 helical C-terminal domain containing protein 1 n=1 Tax=Eublepharis macularius TaxID=481883 RepID=A0AA97LJL7_EUBMA|nr:CHD1 helical C-terminal domain containing protein 1 [Eublepharis macularius]
MELLKSREGKGGVWLADKVLLNEGNVKRGSDLGEWKTSQGFQVTESQLSTIQANEATTGESLARVTPSGDSLIYYTDGLTQDTFKICKEFLRPFKKCLRRLNPPKDLSQEKRLSCTRKNLTILGDHINMFLQHYCKTWELKHWKKMLWRFVALFSALDEKQLCKLYRYSKTNQDSKFLKTFHLMECPDLVALPENHNLLKLRDSWGLCGDVKVQDRLSQSFEFVLMTSAREEDLDSKKHLKSS